MQVENPKSGGDVADAAAPARFLPMAVPVLGDREVELVADAVRTGWISSQGRFVNEFEESFAAYVGCEHGIAVTSGTSALHLALATAGVGPGDEVVLTPITHVACINAVVLTGATPVIADCSYASWGLDPEAVAAKITPRTKAVMPVHLFGHPVDMDPLRDLADRNGFRIIEDAAQAHGAEYKGDRAGGLSDLGCFSFYANKIITTGEGGMIVTNDAALAAKARKLRDQAYEKDRRFLHFEFGFNYRMTNTQAAIGVAQMERIDEFVDLHRANAYLYNELLANVEAVTLPPEQSWAKNVYWMYSVLLDDLDGSPAQDARDRVSAALREVAVDSRPFFYPLNLQPLYADRFAGERYPVAEDIARRGLSLPSGNELVADDIRRIADAFSAALEDARR